MASKTYVLSWQMHRTMTTKGYNLTCRRCGKPLLAKEEVVRQQNGNHTKRYHKACWMEMFIDV